MFSSWIFERRDLEAFHLLLTWLWICAGGLAQFLIVCRHLPRQAYLSSQWKILIGLSSGLLLGPSMVYLFCVGVILSVKMKLSRVLKTEEEAQGIVDAALLFASRAKLGEVFFESIPQFLTQLLMTSAKGQEGVRELSPLQMASVVTSAVTIGLGISKYVIDAGSSFYARTRCKMATRLVLIALVTSEVAFCGGVCRFAFAFLPTREGAGVPPVAVLSPFVALSSLLAMLPLVKDRFQPRFGEYLFLAQKVGIWTCIVVAAFVTEGSLGKCERALIKNNSRVTFVVTMTLTSALNFGLGFFLQKKKSDAKIYEWIESLLFKLTAVLTEGEEARTAEEADDKIQLVEMKPLKGGCETDAGGAMEAQASQCAVIPGPGLIGGK